MKLFERVDALEREIAAFTVNYERRVNVEAQWLLVQPDLPRRLLNPLVRAEVSPLDFMRLSDDELSQRPGIGPATVRAVRQVVAA